MESPTLGAPSRDRLNGLANQPIGFSVTLLGVRASGPKVVRNIKLEKLFKVNKELAI